MVVMTGSAPGNECVGVRDAAQCPTVRRRAPHREWSSPSISSAKAGWGEPWGQLFRDTLQQASLRNFLISCETEKTKSQTSNGRAPRSRSPLKGQAKVRSLHLIH